MSEISSLTVNAVPALPDDIAPETPLLDILRNTRLTGTRCRWVGAMRCLYGAGGRCPVQSCNAALVDAAGKEITTIEGLAGNGGTLHPLQQAFSTSRAANVATASLVF